MKNCAPPPSGADGNDMDEVLELSRLLVELYEKLSSWEHCVVRGAGLTLPQTHTLEILGAHGPMRMKELAEKMGVTTGTLTVTVDKLESKALVRRTPNEEDRRSLLVELTDEGRERFLRHDALHLDLTRELAARLSPEELPRFIAALSRVVQGF